MLNDLLKNHRLILASGSPRRQQFFKLLDVEVEIRLKEVIETYPETLSKNEITDYLAQKKAVPLRDGLVSGDVLITSDTIVWHDGKALGKPKNVHEAYEMLRRLSAKVHEVITSVCFTTTQLQETVHAITKVHFKKLSEAEIDYYIKNYQPFDKAGAYGIQEWIGHIGIEKIEGSYFNVVGLPTHLVYDNLTSLLTSS